jgi:MYXO-CTERM domain-containing protein
LRRRAEDKEDLMRTRTLPFLSLAVCLATIAVGVNRARADVPPPDLCTSPGQSCQNAGAQHNQAGTCVATTCMKTVPDDDGGTMTMTYDCNLCRTPDGGTSGGGGGSSGCAIAGSGPAGPAGGPAVVLALVGLALARRRRPSR